MKKAIISILTISIALIVSYVNFNDLINEHIANLMYYMQYYLIVGILIILIWVLFTDKLIRALTIPISLYYVFHLIINILDIVNPEIKDLIYTTKNINYLLCMSIALALFIIPVIAKLKK